MIYQMTRICRDKNAIAHDDRLDALTMAIAYWLEHMDANADEAMEELTTDKLEDWLNEGVLPNRQHIVSSKCVKNINDLRS